MNVGPISNAILAYPVDVSRQRGRRLVPRHDQDEPIDGEFTVIEEAADAPARRGTVATRGSATTHIAQRLRRLTTRSRRDLDALGLLRAYLPYQEYCGVFVDAYA